MFLQEILHIALHKLHMGWTFSIKGYIQVEARGNALERLREENEGLTEDYNHLRERLGAKEAEVQAAASAVRDLEQQLGAARSSAGRSKPDRQVGQKVLRTSRCHPSHPNLLPSENTISSFDSQCVAKQPLSVR